MDIHPPSRDARGRILPGHSGNPSGRPTTPQDVREALEAGSLRAAQRLVELCSSEDERVALTASETLLARLYGKPTAVSEVTTKQHDIGRAHLEALQSIMQSRRERLGETGTTS